MVKVFGSYITRGGYRRTLGVTVLGLALAVSIENRSRAAGYYNLGGFWRLPVPTTSTILPTSGTTTGGTSVTITGTNFEAQSVVTVGGNACTGIVLTGSTQIVCSTAAHAAGATNVVVTNGNVAATLSSAYTFAAPTTVVTVLTSGTSWTVPGTWNNANNKVECIGGGGAGANAFRTVRAGAAGAVIPKLRISP